tara:strand:- start:600 stop:776 length:177 start_codon:yes stop_codon:yes gene_type:complete
MSTNKKPAMTLDWNAMSFSENSESEKSSNRSLGQHKKYGAIGQTVGLNEKPSSQMTGP